MISRLSVPDDKTVYSTCREARVSPASGSTIRLNLTTCHLDLLPTCTLLSNATANPTTLRPPATSEEPRTSSSTEGAVDSPGAEASGEAAEESEAPSEVGNKQLGADAAAFRAYVISVTQEAGGNRALINALHEKVDQVLRYARSTFMMLPNHIEAGEVIRLPPDEEDVAPPPPPQSKEPPSPPAAAAPPPAAAPTNGTLKLAKRDAGAALQELMERLRRELMHIPVLWIAPMVERVERRIDTLRSEVMELHSNASASARPVSGLAGALASLRREVRAMHENATSAAAMTASFIASECSATRAPLALTKPPEEQRRAPSGPRQENDQSTKDDRRTAPKTNSLVLTGSAGQALLLVAAIVVIGGVAACVGLCVQLCRWLRGQTREVARRVAEIRTAIDDSTKAIGDNDRRLAALEESFRLAVTGLPDELASRLEVLDRTGETPRDFGASRRPCESTRLDQSEDFPADQSEDGPLSRRLSLQSLESDSAKTTSALIKESIVRFERANEAYRSKRGARGGRR